VLGVRRSVRGASRGRTVRAVRSRAFLYLTHGRSRMVGVRLSLVRRRSS
jgi:hypothetical protein